MFAALLNKNKGSSGQTFFIYPLFWGFLWGVFEATLGHTLHLVAIPGLAGFIMFPVGMVFMVRAWLSTGNPSSIFLASTAAAAVKMLDAFLPGPGIFAAVNPALAILCEGLAVAGLFSLVRSEHRFHPFSLLSVSLSWRLIYFGLIAAPAALMGAPNFFMLGPSILFKYLLFEGLINTIILLLILKPIQTGLNPYFLTSKTSVN